MSNVIITGISRGIGKALAEKFLHEGYAVIGTSTTGKSDIQNENLTVLPLNLSDEKSIEACVKNLAGRDIDILINNAGVLLDEDDTQVFPDKLRATLDVNLIGTVAFTERIIPLLKKGTHIVNISSTAGSLEIAGLDHERASHYPLHYPAYKISKAALNMYTRTLAARLHDEGITVSSVHPGWVRTQMGGEEADISPEEAAEGIFATAISRPPSGGFWFKGKELPW